MKKTPTKSKEKKLLFSVTAKDCRWDYFKATGAGGQKRNKTSSAVRCTHKESGSVGQSTESRSQRKNKEESFRRMAESKKFQTWIKIECARRRGEEAEIERDVKEAMRPKNLKIEGKDEKGCWIEVNI